MTEDLTNTVVANLDGHTSLEEHKMKLLKRLDVINLTINRQTAHD